MKELLRLSNPTAKTNLCPYSAVLPLYSAQECANGFKIAHHDTLLDLNQENTTRVFQLNRSIVGIRNKQWRDFKMYLKVLLASV